MATNLYKIDDVLLRAGLAVAAFDLLAFSATVANAQNADLRLSSVALLIMLVACPLVMLSIGWNIRHREKQIVKMWRLIEAQGQVPVQQLFDMTSFGRKQLAAAVDRINNRGNATLVWDETNAVIRDASAQQNKMTHSENCQSCGGSVNIEVSTDQADYTCPFCGSGLDCSRINPLLDKLQLREGLGRRQESALAADATLNLPLFVVLLVVFWPAAVFYAVKKNAARSPRMSRVRKTSYERVTHTTFRSHKEEAPSVYSTTTTTRSKVESQF